MYSYLFRHTAVAVIGAVVCTSAMAAEPSQRGSAGLEEIIVTADPLGAVDSHLVQPVQVLTKDELNTRNTSNIGEALANEPGVSSSDFGPGSGRPIIRGMAGSRVKILENGIGTLDVSTISVDHAVPSEPVFAQQIEIFRGPATLLYGSGASGGLVNIVNDRLLDYVPEGLEGDLTFKFDSTSEGIMGAGSVNAGLGNLALHIDAMARDTEDYEIPGFAELEPDDPDEEKGTLENSSTKSDNLSAGGSYVGERGFIGVSVSRYANNYGVPGGHHHEEEEGAEEEEAEEEEEGGVRIDMEQTRYDLEGALDAPLPGLRQIKTRWAYNDYEHDEVEPDGAVATRFNNEELEGRVEILLEPMANWNGVIGVQVNDKNFSALGEEAFVPPAQRDSVAVFALEKGDFGRWHVDLGLRYEHQDAETNVDKTAHDAYSISGGLAWEYRDGYQLGLSVTHAQRAPNIEELFSDGPHLATNTFEIGNPALRKEKSTNLDLFWHKTAGRLTFSADLFYNSIDDFIFLQEQDQNGDGFADRVEGDFSGDPAEILDPDEDEELLLVLQTQTDTDFMGFELQASYRLIEDQRGVLDARLWTDFVKAERRGDVNLPRITPWRFGGGLSYSRGPWSGNLDYTRVSEQDNTAPLETETDGYNMLNIRLDYTFRYADMDLTAFVRGTNLLDEEARRHTSFVKNIAPLPGRSATLGIRASF